MDKKTTTEQIRTVQCRLVESNLWPLGSIWLINEMRGPGCESWLKRSSLRFSGGVVKKTNVLWQARVGRREWKTCQQTALINHASINHFLHPPFIDKTRGEWAFTAQFLFFGSSSPLCPLLPVPPPPSPLLYASSSSSSSLQFHSLASLSSTYTSRYDFCRIVKQLLANSCSSLISGQRLKRGGEEEEEGPYSSWE